MLKVKDDVQGELLLDHNFNQSTATTIVRMMQDIKEHLQKICSPLQDQEVLKNILTGEIVTNVAVDKCVMLYHRNNAAYAKFINDQLRKNVFNTLIYK